MRRFDYAVATDVAQAVAEGGPVTRFIAGGTNLLDLMKLEIETPAKLVDISRLDLDRVEATDDGGLRIGALVKNSDLAADTTVRSRYPALSRALLAGASGQLRNMATTGGNLLQRTRCPYFYDPSAACNKRAPGEGCDAREGINRTLAIIGTSTACIANHPGDMPVAMRLYDAVIVTQRADGDKRRIPVADFYRLPGGDPARDTNLEPGELITHVELPPPPPGAHGYRKVRDRASYAFALVAAAGALEVKDGKIASARFAFGSIAPMPWRVAEAEQSLVGKAPDAAAFLAAADVALAGAQGFGHNDFKLPLARRTLVALMLELAGEAK